MTRYPLRLLIPCIAGIAAGCAAPIPPVGGGAGERASASAVQPGDSVCNATPDASLAQYIVGYGSLMQDESRQRTAPQAGPAHPVEVSGFRRGWFARGEPVGFSTTFLGATPDANGRLNAVVYQVDAAGLRATDQREASYCRTQVPASAVALLEKSTLEMSGAQVWIYTNRPGTIATPSAEFPIVQSYVDIFVSGCLEQEQRFGLEGYASECVTTTHDWSAHWVNDRLYPRRPFIYQPRAHQIDQLLSRQVPDFFSKVRLQ